MSAKQKEMIRKRIVKEVLRCDLNDQELLRYGQQCADAMRESAALAGQLASMSKEYRGKIDAKDGESSRLADCIRQKYEHRSVECEEAMNFTKKSVTVVRKDTGETIKTRAMTPEEEQELPIGVIDFPGAPVDGGH